MEDSSTTPKMDGHHPRPHRTAPKVRGRKQHHKKGASGTTSLLYFTLHCFIKFQPPKLRCWVVLSFLLLLTSSPSTKQTKTFFLQNSNIVKMKKSKLNSFFQRINEFCDSQKIKDPKGQGEMEHGQENADQPFPLKWRPANGQKNRSHTNTALLTF